MQQQDQVREEFMQEKLKFKSNFIVSNKKRIIAMASFVQEG